MKIKYIISLALGILMMTSCMEDFLQKKPLGKENNQTFYNTLENCEQAVNAIYDPAQWLSMYSRNYWGIGDVCSDDTEKGGQDELDQPDMQALQTFTMQANNKYLTDMWRGFYIGIGRANEMLYRTDESNNPDVEVDATTLARLRGEARFMRAFYYFDLLKIFGAVPLVEEPLQPGEGAQLGNRQDGDGPSGNKQKQAIRNFIINELEAIVYDVPWEYDVTNYGRVTRGAVLGLLTKAYIYNKSWSSALTTAETLMAQYPTLDVNYQDVFRKENEQNQEILFSIQFIDGVTGNDYDRSGEGTERCTYVGVRNVINLDNNNSSKFMGEYGYGFNLPRQELVDLFHEDDPRLDLIMARGDSIWWEFTDNGGVLQKHPIDFPTAHTGYYTRKGAVDYDQYSPAKPQSTGLDYPLIRLADVYLFAAEAALQGSGDKAKALEYVNAVRERARNSARKELGFRQYEAITSNEPADLTDIDIDILFEERRRELFCEGHRFFDMVRKGNAQEEIADKVADSFGQSIAENFKSGVNEVFPIPSSEILRHTGGNLIQNPGY